MLILAAHLWFGTLQTATAAGDATADCLRSMNDLHLNIWTESVGKASRVGRPLTYLPAQNVLIIARDDRLVIATPDGEIEVKPNETACGATSKSGNVRERMKAILEGELNLEKTIKYSTLKRNLKTINAGTARQIFSNCERVDELRNVVAELRRVISGTATETSPASPTGIPAGTAL